MTEPSGAPRSSRAVDPEPSGGTGGARPRDPGPIQSGKDGLDRGNRRIRPAVFDAGKRLDADPGAPSHFGRLETGLNPAGSQVRTDRLSGELRGVLPAVLCSSSADTLGTIE